MKNIFYISILVFLFGCCNNETIVKENNADIVPDDFYFEIQFGEEKHNFNSDNFNSKNRTFYRRYSNGDTTIAIDLTQQDIETIYSAFVQNNFLKLPAEVTPDTLPGKSVYFAKLSFHVHGQLKQVQSFNNKNVRQTEELNRFESVRKTILVILKAKPNYKSLRPSNIIGI